MNGSAEQAEVKRKGQEMFDSRHVTPTLGRNIPGSGAETVLDSGFRAVGERPAG